ncbi:MAG: hypothetical protein J7L91_05760 [Candidatus Korarchaeota archaeon]|nr:hypothetical protein [Candidatus Korarchaeota archaeon]
MRRCLVCWTYTFRERCPICGSVTISPHPEPFTITPRNTARNFSKSEDI